MVLRVSLLVALRLICQRTLVWACQWEDIRCLMDHTDMRVLQDKVTLVLLTDHLVMQALLDMDILDLLVDIQVLLTCMAIRDPQGGDELGTNSILR